MSHVIKTNKQGIQIHNKGKYWAILKPLPEGIDGPLNKVYHVGQAKYVKSLWNQRFCYELVDEGGPFPVQKPDLSMRI